MILRYDHLSLFPKVFQAMTGLRLAEFDEVLEDVLPRFGAAETQRLSRAMRRRAIGGGHPFDLEPRDQVWLMIVWLRRYPIHEVLGFLFDVSDSTVCRYIRRVLPLLEAAGRTTMRLPDPGRKQRRQLDALLQETPELAVVIDSFEPRIQRPRTRSGAAPYYSGKKKQHTLKSQIAVDELTGAIVAVADSVPGPTADIPLLAQSKLLERLPEGVGALGDLGSVGIAKLHPHGHGATPRQKPRGQPRPPEDGAVHTAFAKRRIVAEHSILRLRHYQALTQTDRNQRQQHTPRVVAVAGLVNRQIRHRLPAAC
jgi:hypothetical protein